MRNFTEYISEINRIEEQMFIILDKNKLTTSLYYCVLNLFVSKYISLLSEQYYMKLGLKKYKFVFKIPKIFNTENENLKLKHAIQELKLCINANKIDINEYNKFEGLVIKNLDDNLIINSKCIIL
jgi:hypothetical protein